MDKLQFTELMEKYNVWKKVDFNEAVGKTVELVIEDDCGSQNLIVFTDNTFIGLKAVSSWENTAEMEYIDPIENKSDFVSSVREYFPDLYNEFYKIEEEKRKAWHEEMEYKRFLELQKKYAK